ncbi:GHKL domain-containing protein [Clostridium estertheticum]|uniref:histidine kinase n=2 Tax=Clostridium estertheticum TaxID=238834 RepID=A0A5N7IUN2_9CLOT|nr:GHKL domain-containing protein [Clostridium estertheticum]MPQ64803.1 GHKL domain-containing protein [Clostridium estertheticum]
MKMVIEIILDIFEALLLVGTFSLLTNQKKYIVENKIRSGLFCISYIVTAYLSTNYFNDNLYHTLLTIIVSILLLTFITKINLYSSIIIFSLFFTMIFVTETLIQFIEMFILKVELNEILTIYKYALIFRIGSKLLQILVLIIISKCNIFLNKRELFNSEKSLFSKFFIELGVFSLFLFVLLFSVLDIKNNKIYGLLIFNSFFIFLLIAFMHLKKNVELINISNKYKVQQYQISNMEEIINIIRQEKHDYANHINVIQALCCLNKPNTVERIKEYVSKLSDIIHLSFRYLDTGNDYLDGLLSIKNNYATQNNIDFKVVINESFSLLKIREDELISIISNIIDNAFEALKIKALDDNKEISITTFLDDKKFCIEISNNGGGIPKEIINKIFEKGYSTKTKGKGDHGYGLFITKQLVEHNNGIISVERASLKTKFLIEFLM